MSSQLDLDQGGTTRQYQAVWLGPSIGWVDYPTTSILQITSAGTYTISRGTTLIQIAVASGVVNIDLPSAKAGAAGPLPGQSIQTPTIISDILGTAGGTLTVNIVPNGSEEISGLTSVQLSASFGTILLNPNLASGGWTLGQ